MYSSLADIIKKIAEEKTKVVSFDIFDTLLLRPMIAPVDAFRLVGKIHGYKEEQFVTMRTVAEKEARNQRPFGHDDVTFDDIYHQMELCFDVEHDKAKQIQQTEMDIEERLLYQRKSAKQLFDVALTLKKPVIIVSDMYLPKHFIERLLQKNGYEGYQKLYLSCDYMESKGSKKLFNRVIRDFKEQGISAKEIVHIGDNPQADVKQAEACGLQAVLLPRAMGMFKANKWFTRTMATRYEVDNTFLVGFLANLLYDDPFVQFPKDSILDGNSANLGFITAPMLFSFTKWMLEDLRREGTDKLLMAYRDGYLPEKIINILRPYCSLDVEVEDLYLNRTLRYSFAAKDAHPLTATRVPFSTEMTAEEFLRNRLLITEEEELEEVFKILKKSGFAALNEKIGDKHRIYRLSGQLEKYLKRHANQQIELVNEYCREKTSGADKLAVFDVGYQGSVARFLHEEQGCKNITGYQLFATPHVRVKYGSICLKSYIEYGFYVQGAAMILHPLIEQIISTPSPSPVGIKKEHGVLEFLYEQEEATEEDDIFVVQNRVLEYCQGFVNRFGDLISWMEFDPYNEFQLLIELCNRPCKSDAIAVRNLGFKDATFIEGSNKGSIYARWFDLRFPSPVKKALSNSKPVPPTEVDASFSAKEKLKDILRKVHLFNFAKKIYIMLGLSSESDNLAVPVLPNTENRTVASESVIQEMKTPIESSLELLHSFSISQNRVVFCGDITSYDKGMCAFLNKLVEKNPQFDWLFLSEVTWQTQERTSEKIHMPIHIVPELFGKNRYRKGLSVELAEAQKLELAQHSCLQQAVENFRKRFPDMGMGYPEFLVLEAYHYFNKMFEILKPKLIILWNQFYATHQVIEYVARAHSVAVNYMEFGSLPGTVALETMGQMGESYPSREYEEFKELPVSDAELEQAQEIWNFLKESKLNRNPQPESWELEECQKRLVKNRPVVFYAGQFDFESGLYPYTERSKMYHSPVFTSSDDAAAFLGELAKKNGWELIYKPHPLMKELSNLPKNVHVIRNCDIHDLIDLADVTVTILSQTGYVATIREKPVVMLGYTQLRGKGCTYEAFSKNLVEPVIQEAISYGMTDTMKELFKRHIAQMNKYYLYDDISLRDMRFGREIGMVSDCNSTTDSKKRG